MQYESGTSSVQARMCNANQAYHQYKQECAVQASKSSSFGVGGHYLLLMYQAKKAGCKNQLNLAKRK